MSKKTSSLFMIVTLSVIGITGITVWLSSAAPPDVVYFDLEVDESRQLLYGSDMNGGSIHVIDQDTLQVTSEVSVGSGPAGIDVKPDGTELAVALSDQGEIAFVDLETLLVITRTVPSVTVGPNRPYDVLYGRPGRLYSVGNPGSSGLDYVHVFDSNTRIELGRSAEIMRAAPRLAMTADYNTLYVSQVIFSPQKIYRFDITTDIPIQTAAAPHGPVAVNTLAINPEGTHVYSSRGQVWSSNLSTQLGTFSPTGEEIEYVDTLRHFFISEVSQIVEFDADSYEIYRYHPVSGAAGVAKANSAANRLYVSTDKGIEEINLDIRPSVYLPAILYNFCSDFFDDFSNPNSGWPVGEHEYYTYGYLSGEYQIRSKKVGYFYLFESPSCRRENYVVEVDARWVGAPGSGHGIIFGIVGDFDRYYLFDVNTDYQMYRFLYRSPSGWETLVSPTTSNAINSGNATNRLKAIRNGSEITLAVNSTTLKVLNDYRITGLTGAGIVSEPYGDRPDSVARFDNFSMVKLASNGGAALDSMSTVEKNGLRANRNSYAPSTRVFDWESYSEE